MLRHKMCRNIFVRHILYLHILFLLIYVRTSFASASARNHDIHSGSQKESLRTRPRQARLALQEINLIPRPEEDQRQNDKFLKNHPKVSKMFLLYL